MKSSFARKLMYMGMALVLFAVILVIRGPIERERAAHKLSEATLGNVDPTSSTMLVVLGGMRGIASNILWKQAIDLQREHDWARLEVVVDSITRLEPHFISVWTFQGWNQAYNVAAEWDQVADKYYWIKKGIKFLQRGTEFNEQSPELRWDVGWTYFHKIGRADESEQLRQLFRADNAPEVDSAGRVQEAFNRDSLDNYFASHDWFNQAVNKCDGPPLLKPKRMGEVAFRSYPSHALINYAIYMEKEGHFDEQIKADWLHALQNLERFANHDYEFTKGRAVHLDYPPDIKGDLYRATSVLTDSRNLNELLGKGVENLTAGQQQQVPADWEKLLAIARRMINDLNKTTIAYLPAGASAAYDSMEATLKKMEGVDRNVLTQPGAAGDAARTLLAEFAAPADKFGRLADEELYWTDRYASMINYRYWQERAVCEHEWDTINARHHFYDGEKLHKAADLEKAEAEFEAGLKLWKSVIEKFERVRDDDLTAEETAAIVKTYLNVRNQLDRPDLKPEDIPFKEWVDRFTPHMLSAEEYEEMAKRFIEVQNQGAGGDAQMKKFQQEKLKGALKDSVPPGKASPKVPLRPEEQ